MSEQSTFITPNYIIDTFDELQDLKYSDLQYLEEYRELKMKKNDGIAVDEGRLLTLETIFQNKIVTAARWNKFQNCLVSMETFIKDEVEGYIQTKQNEFQIEIDKFNYIEEYNPLTQYYKKNIVSLNGTTFLCLKDALGDEPNPTQHTEHWAILSYKGDKGETGYGVGLLPRGNYDDVEQYHIDDLVQYNGNLYRCILDSLGNLPTDEIYFEIFLSANGQELFNNLAGGGRTIETVKGNSEAINSLSQTMTNNLDNLAGEDRIDETIKGNHDLILEHISPEAENVHIPANVGLSEVDNIKQLPIGGGNMEGILTAQSNTLYTTRQVRNIILSPYDADLNTMQNGEVWIKYK